MSETVTMTLTGFLMARIAEREASAGNYLMFDVRDGRPGNYSIRDEVLADCEAKRGIVELHVEEEIHWDDGRVTAAGWCSTCHDGNDLDGGFPCGTLSALATIHADHPDYREEWRP